jgi:nucleotide-binding universal stress UspA family protein
VNIQPKRILWPTDFSELSAKSGTYARAFAQVFQAELHVIHVCPPLHESMVTVPLSPAVTVGMTQQDILRAAEARLRDLAARELRGYATIAFATRLGVPWQEICRYAESEQIDLIILSTHGYTGIQHLLIGSVAERVVQHAPCPVLTVKTNNRDFVQG